MRGPRGADPVDDVAAQDAEVGDGEARWLAEHLGVDAVHQPGAEPPVARRLLALEPPEHHVVPVEHGVDEDQRLVRRVLQVVVHRDDVVTGRLAQPGQVGVVLAVVAQQVEGDDVLGVPRAVGDDLPAAVLAAVVDEDQLVPQTGSPEDLEDPVDRRADDLDAVVHGDDDRVAEVGGGRRPGPGRRGRADSVVHPTPLAPMTPRA